MRPVLLFFLLTFIASWILFSAGGLAGLATKSTELPILSSMLITLGVWMPSLVALALTWREQGLEGMRAILRRILETRIEARWVLFAILYMAAIKLAAALVYRGISGEWPAFGRTPFLLMVVAMLFSTPFQAGEEIGWRGFALPRLARHMGLGRAGVLVGVAWACWHLPLFFIPGADTHGQSFPLYLVGVVAISVAMTWLYWRSGGSLLMTMLMHAAINNTKDIVPSAALPTDPSGLRITPIGAISAAWMWVGAAWFLTRMRGGRLADT